MVLVVLGVVLVIIEVAANPLLLLRLKKPPPGPRQPPGNLVRVENLTRAISRGGLHSSAGTIWQGFSPMSPLPYYTY